MAKPKVGLKIFSTYSDLHQWLHHYNQELKSVNATIKITTNEIHFPNGSILYLGYGEGRDLDKYLSLEYDFVVCINNNQRLKISETINKL
jgi:hypothetical protein